MSELKIRTVRGDIAPSDLGWCQCHEHLFIEKGQSFEVNPALCMDDIEKSTQELTEYKQAGGSAYVDAQPVGCGRMAEELVHASEQTGVHIVAVTGFHKLVFYEEDSFVYTKNEDELTQFFVDEVQKGMISSATDGEKRISARAGIVKIAVETEGFSSNPVYEKLANAALEAAKITGAPVLAHFDDDADAFDVIERMQQKGILADRLIACHLDRARYDKEYHVALAKTGAYLEYDTINRLKYHSNEKEIELIEYMLEYGHVRELLLSLDTTAERLRAYGADMGLDFILKDFSDMLLERGINGPILHRLMETNPSNALSLYV